MPKKATRARRLAGQKLLLKLIEGALDKRLGTRAEPATPPDMTVRISATPGSPPKAPTPEVLAPPSQGQPTGENNQPEVDKMWCRVLSLGVLTKEEEETLLVDPHRQRVRGQIAELLSDNTRPERAILHDVAEFCKMLAREIAFGLPQGNRSVVAPSNASPAVPFTPEQISWIDRVLFQVSEQKFIEKGVLEGLMRDPRFNTVEIYITTLPRTEDKAELLAFAKILADRINRMFALAPTSTRPASRTPAAYEKALEEIIARQPSAEAPRTAPLPSSGFELRPTLFRGHDQRKWDKVLTESSFSIMQKAMRSVLIAPQGTVDGVQNVSLRAVEGLFLVEVNVFFPVCTHYIQSRRVYTQVFRDLLSPSGVSTTLNDDVAEIAMTLIVIATVGTTPGIPRAEPEKMIRVQEYASNMALRILGKAVVTSSALVAELFGQKRGRSPHAIETELFHEEKPKTRRPHTNTATRKTRGGNQSVNQEQGSRFRCFNCQKLGHKAAQCNSPFRKQQ